MHEIRTFILCILLLIIIQSSNSLSPLLQPINNVKPSLPDITHPLRSQIQVLQPGPIPTNKFWVNMLVSKQNDPVHVHPYVVKLENNYPFGLAISHAFFLDEKVTSVENGRMKYYYNTLNNDNGFSATEINALTPKYINYHDNFGCILQVGNNGSRIVYPIIRGMAYVTAEYENMTPIIFTTSAFLSVNGQGSGTVTGKKFTIEQNSGQRWILYVLGGKTITLNFGVNYLTSTSLFTGTLRLIRLPKTDQAVAESILDTYSEKWVVGGDVDIQTDIDPSNSLKASYTFSWKTKGTGELLHFAFPHHQDILTEAQKTALKLWSTTKGELVGYTGTTWKLIEDGLSHVTFLPPRAPDSNRIPDIKNQVILDIQQYDTNYVTLSHSNYFAGKGSAKIGLLCLIAKELNISKDVVDLCITKAKQAMYPYLVNSNWNSLRYESYWGGVIGNVGITCIDPTTNCPGLDYGSSYYNDHHYHYGYFLHAAAIIAHLDSSWIVDSKAFIENLIRDVANPSTNDPYFPVFRSFDWFSGHSWSQGLFPQTDGKDQESTSEEINFHYGLMLWGLATNNPNMEKLGNIMFAVAKRSIQKYFLMKSDNLIHPPLYVQNKVTGIFFENKVEYNTWFGPNKEYIHGIQMIPFLPVNELVRDYQFVKDEWDSILSSVNLDDSSIWKGILYLSYATVNKDAAWNVLSSNTLAIDNGLSRGWALYSIASRYGAPLPPVSSNSNPITTTPINPKITATSSNNEIPTTSNNQIPVTSNNQIPTNSNTNTLAETSTQITNQEVPTPSYSISIESLFNETYDKDSTNSTTPSLSFISMLQSLPSWLFITVIVGACAILVLIIGVIVLIVLYKKKIFVLKKNNVN